MAPFAQATKVVTRKGIAVFPYLSEPDTKFNPEGRYGVKIRLTAEDAQPLIEAIQGELPKAQALLDEHREKAPKNKRDDFKVVSEPWAEEDNGDLTFNFGMKASGISKKTGKPWKMTPRIVDALGKTVKPNVKIGGGSIIRVSAELFPYYNASSKSAGISLKLVGVQVLVLKQYGERSAEEMGFEIEEDGFSVADIADEFGSSASDSLEDQTEEAGTFSASDF